MSKAMVMQRAADYRAQGMSPRQSLKKAWADQGNPISAATASTSVVALLVIAYIAWCWYESKRKGLPWTWQPWKGSLNIARPLPAPPVNVNSRYQHEDFRLILP